VQVVLDGTTYDPAARPSMKKILQRLQSLAKTVQDVPLSASPPPAAAAVVVAATATVVNSPAAAPAAAGSSSRRTTTRRRRAAATTAPLQRPTQKLRRD
jgi:hypothetical protein